MLILKTVTKLQKALDDINDYRFLNSSSIKGYEINIEKYAVRELPTNDFINAILVFKY
jgi:hypothetical protein